MAADARVVVVLAGGGPLDPAAVPALPADVRVIAADAGARLAPTLGLVVHELVGDLDSLATAEVAALEAAGATVDRHPPVKDATDLELALARAAVHEPTQVWVLAGGAGRLDHLLANALLLGAPAWAGLRLDAVLGSTRVHVVRDRRAFSGDPGELVSLLAVGRPASGVRTSGLLYPLSDEALEPGSSRGLSNELTGTEASVTVADGVVLVVRPGELGTHVRDGFGPI